MPLVEQMVVILDHFQCGLSYPLSPFLLEVLDCYQIQVCHLAPTAVLHLSIFAHLCDAFLATQTNLLPFSFLYEMRSVTPVEEQVASSYCFVLHPETVGDYIKVQE